MILELQKYRAEIAPELGANCFSLTYDGRELLRKPSSKTTLCENPNVYGLPLLFPPNRICGGEYSFEGRKYRFPINEPSRGHHVHGFLSSTRFEPEDVSDNASAFVYRATAEKPYLSFPHAFTMRLVHRLSADGLHTSLTVTNDGAENMPFGAGFHAALSAKAGDRLCVSATRQWLLNPDTIIPTGEWRAASFDRLAQGERISIHLDNSRGRATLSSGDGCVQMATEGFGFWMLWNGDGQSGFVCPEPQTWMVDAPNSRLPEDVSGFSFLRAGESRTVSLHLWFEPTGEKASILRRHVQ